MEIFERVLQEFDKKKQRWHMLEPREFETYAGLLAGDDSQKLAFILGAMDRVRDSKLGAYYEVEEDRAKLLAFISLKFMEQLLKTKLTFSEDGLIALCDAFSNAHPHHSLFYWPIPLFIAQLERNIRDTPLSDKLGSRLEAFKNKLAEEQFYDDKVKNKALTKLESMVFAAGDGNGGAAIRPQFFPNTDGFGKHANATIKAIQGKEQGYWFESVALVQNTSGGKPTKKFLDAGKAIVEKIGRERFWEVVGEWFNIIINQPGFDDYSLLDALSTELAKGYIWLCSLLQDRSVLLTMVALAERAYRKIPGRGPAGVALGNACFYTLANTGGLEGIGLLSRLKMRVKQNNAEKIIDKYLQEAAAAHGVTVNEIEDMSVDDFGLVDGKREYVFDGYTAVLAIAGVGKTELGWLKADGNPQKAVPASVKEKYAAELKEIKNTAKQIETTLTAQRDRVDRLFKGNRVLNGERFNELYFSHGLMSYLAKKLIWNIEAHGTRVAGVYLEHGWINVHGEAIDVDFGADVSFSLWHPVFATLGEVKAWRELFLDRNIAQPLKQAFREVYLLTDAEINTRLYSNRMAAHLLKQHQFSSLAKTRGWRYSLLGSYDDGRYNEAASIGIPDYGFRAEYWVNEVSADNAMSDTGIWLYVATDQVRFLKADSDDVVELTDVPAIVLSEVMRDVDLFVGVASVGNDPAWRDSGGLIAYRDYWEGYSFGELTEVAKTRKQILGRLLPRLKIATVAEIKDRFLFVKGKLRTYKIHLGSTNILMEPNDQYLCIVPDRTSRTDTVFLPFEGDNGLSIILSKAFLLAADEKITDETIIRQIQ